MLAGGFDVVVDVAVGLTGSSGDTVGQAELQEPLDGGNDFRDGFDRPDVVVGRQDIECCHVGLEELDLACRELAPVHACGRGPLEEGVIDVGHVLDVGNALAAVTPRTVQKVERDIARGMAHVGGVVRGDSADVQ